MMRRPSMRNLPAKKDPKARANDHDRWVPVLYQSPRAGVGEALPSLSTASDVDLHIDCCKHTSQSATLAALRQVRLTGCHWQTVSMSPMSRFSLVHGAPPRIKLCVE